MLEKIRYKLTASRTIVGSWLTLQYFACHAFR
jgi:hypothetical protein